MFSMSCFYFFKFFFSFSPKLICAFLMITAEMWSKNKSVAHVERGVLTNLYLLLHHLTKL